MVGLNSVFEVGFKYVVNDQVLRNFIHYKTLTTMPDATGPATQIALLNEIADADAGSPRMALVDFLGTNAVLQEISVQMVFPTRFRAARESLADSGVNILGACTAQNVQVAIEKFGDQANPKNIGGVRVGGVPGAGYAGGLVVNDQRDLAVALATAWFSLIELAVGLETTSMIPVIANRENLGDVENPQWRITSSTVVTGVSVKNQIRTMRRRTVGLGE